jgi:propionyl-CoA synthetase
VAHRRAVPGQRHVLAPTAIRVLKKQDPALLRRHDLSSLKALFLAGEPLDEPTARWISEGIGKPIVDNYWQTETGWPIIATPRGVEALPSKFGSPGVASYGYDVRLFDEITGEEVGNNTKGVVAVVGPLPPGCMTTIWGDDERFVETYWHSVPGKTCVHHVSTGASATTTAISSSWAAPTTSSTWPDTGWERARSRNPSVRTRPWPKSRWWAIADALKGQVAIAFAVPRDPAAVASAALRAALQGEIFKQVDASWAPWRARPACTSSPPCPRRARASCCAGPSRRSARAATPAT